MSDASLRAPRLTPAVRTAAKAVSAIGKLQAKHDASLASRGVGSISEDITVTAISSESVVSVLYKPRGLMNESYELNDTERKRIRELVSKALANPIWRKSNSALAKLWNGGREKRRFATVLEHLQHLQGEADDGDFFEAIQGVFEILLSSERDMLVERPLLVGIPFRIVDSNHHAPVAEAVEDPPPSSPPPVMESKTLLLAMETIWVLFDRPPQSPLYRLCLPSSVLENENLIPKFLSVAKKAIDEPRIAELWALAFVKAASTEELGKCVRDHDGISIICDFLCSPSQPQSFTASMILTCTFFLLFGSNSSSPLIAAAMNPTTACPSIPVLPRLMSSTAVLPAVLLAQLVKTRVGRERLRGNASFLSTAWQKIPEMAQLVMKLNDDSTIAREHLVYIMRCFSVGFVGLIHCGIVYEADSNELVISRLHLAVCDSLLAVEDADIQYLASVALLLMLESRLIAFQAAKGDPSGFWTGSPSLAQQFFSKNMLFLDSKRFEAKVVAVSQRVALALVRGFTQIQQAYESSDRATLHPRPLKLFLAALGRCFPMRGRQSITPCHTLLWFARKENGYDLDEDDVSGLLNMLEKFIALIKSSILKSSPNDHLAILVMATLWELCRQGWSRNCIERDMVDKVLSVAWLYSQQRKVFSEPTAWCLGVVWVFVYQTGGRRAFAKYEYSDSLITAVLRTFRSGPALSILLNLCMIVLHKNPREKQHQNFGVDIVEPLLDIIKPVTKEEPVAPEPRRLALKLLRTLVDRSRAHEEELVRLNTSMLEVYIAILRENPDPVLLEYVCHRIATMAIKSANRELLFAMGGTEGLLKLWATTDLASSVNEGTAAVDDEPTATRQNAFSLLLNALLNVSMESVDNQMLICRNGLESLHRLLVNVTNSGGDEETFAEGIMVNLKRCASNRSILYNAQLDSAILHARMGDSESARLERAKDDKHGRRKRQLAFRKTALKPMRKRWHIADDADAAFGESEYVDDEEDEGSYDEGEEVMNTMYGSFLWNPVIHRSGAKMQKSPLGRAETAVTLSIPKSASSPGQDMSKFKFSLNVPEAILATQDLSLEDKAAPLATLVEPDVDGDKQREILVEPAASGGNKFASKLKQSSSERRLKQLLDEHELICGPTAGTGSSTELGKMACWRAGLPNSFSEKLFGPRLQLDNGTDVYVYHQEVDGSGAIAPKQLRDDDILGSIPCPDDLGIGAIPSFNQSAFFPLEESPYSLRGSLSRFYFKSAVDELEAGLRADFEGMNLTSALHDTSNDDDQFTLDIDLDLTKEDNGDDGDGESAKDSGPPWDSTCSVFEPRVRESDARSMMDTTACYRRAFRSDWDKCMKKGDRFLNIIKKGCTDPKDKAIIKTAQIMEEYYDRIIQCFVTYCCVADATNCSWMTFGAFTAFVGDAEIADEDSSSCRVSDIDTIFKATDFDSTRGKAGNPGKSLTRSEFAESLIRISKAKFGGRNIDAHMTIERLLKHVLSHVGEAANDFRSEWRPQVLYMQEIDDVLRKHMPVLDRIFYERDERDFWSLDTWEDTLAAAEMYEDSFTRHEGNMTFYFGKMVVVDTEKHAEQYQGLDWLAFLEALVHVSRLKEFPTRERLEELECADIIDYALRLRNEGLVWMQLLTGENAPPPSTATPLEKFAFQLDCCLHIFCFFLDKKFGANDERVTAFGSIMDRRV